jgi:glycine amidinotransferase
MDSTVIPLRPGLLLVDGNYFKPELYPELASWDKVIAPTPNRKSMYDNADMLLASTSIDINVLSVNRNLVICHNEFYPDLQPILKPYGIECVPVRFRHGRIFMGAFHCITLDVRRDSVLEDYLE